MSTRRSSVYEVHKLSLRSVHVYMHMGREEDMVMLLKQVCGLFFTTETKRIINTTQEIEHDKS